MPVLSMFNGIIVRMFSEGNTPHKSEHIHVQYQDQYAVYDLEGNCLEGKMSVKQHRLIVAWIELRKDELYANWQLLSSGQRHFRIEPLR